MGARAWRFCAAVLLGAALAPFLLPDQARAQAECACLWQGAFADVALEADLVVAGRVLRIKGNAVDIAVEETLQGRTFREEIRVWMQTRDYCRPPAEDFPVDSRWIMVLSRIETVPEGGFDPSTPNQSFGRVGDYYLSSCGGYWLSFSGEAVTGNLIEAPRWARDPEMTPVLIGLLRAYLRGDASRKALLEATREDPALLELKLNTKAFLRGQDRSSN